MSVAPKVIRNPNQSIIARDLPLNIARHHLMRAKQVLAINQNQGRFTKTDYDTFIGVGSLATARLPLPGEPDRAPPGTTRRDLATIVATPENIPFPGRIFFTSAQTADLSEALAYLLKRFNQLAPRSGAGARKKGYSTEYAKSLIVSINGMISDPLTVLRSLTQGTREQSGLAIEVVNIAPQASTIEVDIGVMYDIAIELAGQFAPGVSVVYDYVNSDQLGKFYGRGTGGPGPAKARLTSRAYPVVYALPRIIIAVAGATAGAANINTRIVKPGRKVSYRVKKMRTSGTRRS
jgi:hypothetical protein